MKILKKALYTVILSGFLCGSALIGKPIDLKGEKAPEWVLNNTEGNKVRASDFEGKVLIVNFWATWCPACRHEIPDLVKLQKEHDGKAFTIIGIAIDAGETNEIKAFIKEKGINYPVLRSDKDVIHQFENVPYIPTLFLINRKGIIVDVIVGSVDFKELEKRVYELLNEDEEK